MEFIREFFSAPVLWFIAGIIMLIMEFALPGLIIFFFGIGAVVVGLLTLIFDLSLNAQLIIFILTSVITLLSLRKWLKKTFIGRVNTQGDGETSLDDFSGERAVVVKEIVPGRTGSVEFHGAKWNATADEIIKKDTPVTIVSKQSITLHVKPLS